MYIYLWKEDIEGRRVGNDNLVEYRPIELRKGL